MKKEDLTKAEQEYMGIAKRLLKKYGYMPVASQIAEIRGVDRQAVYQVIRNWERKGWVARTPGVPRSMRFI